MIHKDRDQAVFVGFAIHKGKGVVVVHNYGGDACAPDVEHGGVDDVGEGGLGVIGDGFAEGFGVVAAFEKPALAAEKGG